MNSMKNNIKKIRVPNWIRKSVLLSLTTVLLVFGLIGPNTPPKAVSAANARFNFLEGDLEMLQGAGPRDSDWRDPVDANAGERVAVLFYFHNGVVNSTARNTTLKVNLPQSPANQIVMNGQITADGIDSTTDTIINGQVFGRSGLTISLPSGISSQATYVPGSTKIFLNNSQTGTPMPDGITGSGLNIGNVNGCWEFAGFVTFLVELQGQPNLILTKQVANSGQNNFQNEVTANVGSSVDFRMTLRNTGNAAANNIVLRDILPSHLSINSISIILNSGQSISASGLTGQGITINNFSPGATATILMNATVNSDIPTTLCNQRLTNVIQLLVGGIIVDQKQASVLVNCPTTGMVVEKTVWNGTAFVEQNNARIGELITYQIKLRNTGNTALTGVIVRDPLPENVIYVGPTKVNGNTVSDDIITSGGLNVSQIVGLFQPGQEIVITLVAKVIGCPPVGQQILVNSVFARAEGVSEQIDIASTIVTVTAPNKPVTAN